MVRNGYLANEPILVQYRRAVADLENALARRKRELRAALIAGQRQKLEFELTEHKARSARKSTCGRTTSRTSRSGSISCRTRW